MPGLLDTNVIVRYLTDDPPGMADVADRLIEGVDLLYVPDVVIMESAYVLSSFYGVARERVVDQLSDFLGRENVEPLTLDKGLAVEALMLCRPSGRVSFVDALTWAAARQSGVRVVYSWDDRFPSTGIEVRSAIQVDGL